MKSNKKKQFTLDYRNQITDFLEEYWDKDFRSLIVSDFFIQLKPSLQNTVCDHIFVGLYQKFSLFFQGTAFSFRREIMKKFKYTNFKYLAPKYEVYKDDYFTMPEQVDFSIIKKGEFSEGVYFITKGTVYVGNHSKVFSFFKFRESSFFGEMSVLLGIKSKFTFYYMPETPVSCFFVSLADFNEVCQKYPGSAAVLRVRAKNKL